jgi:phosphoribosylformylglycinamidine cyclo-ligase
LLDKHDTIGIDCVAMCSNDVVCTGGKPLFFLDYVAVGKLNPKKVADIVKGVSEGCIQSDCALIGGETAEMPGFYPEDDYDLAGFCVGVVEKSKIIDGTKISEGDKIIGLPSTGVHSNGFSLVRKIFNPTTEKLNEYIEDLGKTLGEALLAPTRIYVKPMLSVIEKFDVLGISHITGGGFYENMPRMINTEGLGIKINKGSWDVLPIFNLLQSEGNVPEEEMFNTYNMGIGMCFIVKADQVDAVMNHLSSIGEKSYVIGEIVKGQKGVTIC